MRKISREKRTLLATLITVTVFLIFIFSVYLPSRNTRNVIKAKLLNVEVLIKEIESLVVGNMPLRVGIEVLGNQLKEMDERFPIKEEECLKLFSDFARQSNVELIAINPRSKVPFFYESGNKTDSKVCQSIFVSIQLRCFFKDLVAYIETIEQHFLAYTTIERLIINKDRGREGKLNVKIDLNLYLLI